MITAIGLEYYKIRRKKLWIMITLLLAMEMLWAFVTASISISRSAEHDEWETLFYCVSSINGFFMPIVTAIVASRLCDMEHKGATWTILAATNVSRIRLYTAKYICANSLLLYGILAQTVLIIAFGQMKDFSGSLPFEWLIRFIAGTMLTTLAVTALQQWISWTVRNQAFALCLGMLGGFIGMTAALFPAGVRHLFIWSYYSELSPVILRFAESSSSYFIQPMNFSLMLAALGMTVLWYTVGSLHIARKEV
ncbi:ABC transporter permease [Paenibacillus xylaniclasticus]|uniref:ABC transporter permease n=1 Tax=Paenibacillus xylaniclasticus TaxID=588083 RepID=UPI000FDC9217|nr:MULTISPECIES: ABC transporter permease [Paenibacillus]GFN32219.1 multidrug ABC transporter permease [Paenibacillus curdlanolyticus]